MRTIAAAFSLAFLIFEERVARAEDDSRPLQLTWTAPGECPSEATVRERASARMPPDATLRATGNVERVRGKYRLHLGIGALGERVLEAPSCDALASSAAVVLAMSATPAEEAASAPAPSPPSTPLTEPADADASSPPKLRRAQETVYAFRAHAIADSGMLPHTAIGGGVAIGVDPLERLHVEIAGSLFGEMNGSIDTAPSRGARFAMISVDVRSCNVFTRKVELAGCVGFDLASLTVEGFGTARIHRHDLLYAGSEGGLFARVPLGRGFALRAGFGMFVPFARPSYVIANVGELFRPDPVVLRGFVGPELTF